MLKPTIFVGSSSERLRIVGYLHNNLRQYANILRWDKNVFRPGRYTLQDLEDAMKHSHFALFVLAGEDLVKWRKRLQHARRDNVVLEIGMAIGILGYDKVLLLYSKSDRPRIPTDLSGFNYLTLEDRVSLGRSIGRASELIRQVLIADGLRSLPTDSDRSVTYRQRNSFSTDFVSKCIHTLHTFAGDLGWLSQDLPMYRNLAKRGVRLRFLTDSPRAPVIRLGKHAGLLFREYPIGANVRIRASLSDVESQSDSRMLVVQKQISHSPTHKADNMPYNYRMKIYSGPREYSVITALSSYFDDLFARGTPL